MPLDEPAWWYGPPGDWRARVLAPVARVWAWQCERRMARQPNYRSALPVICIGNFTAGGTGKTPLSLLIADLLKARGLVPAILTRGYGSKAGAARWVDLATDSSNEVGDEPMLLARAAPVLISPDRAAGARMIEARRPALDAIIMDDGLQNPTLAKDLRIAVIDGRRGFGNGAVIPAGPLRARVEVQLGFVDAIVVNKPPKADGEEPPAIADWLRQCFGGPILKAHPEPLGDMAWLADRRVVAFAGIANPARFYDLLAARGARVIERRSFPDHQAYTPQEASDLLALANRHGAALVTTEKDQVRLIGGTGAIGDLLAASRTLPIRLVFEGQDMERLEATIVEACMKRVSASPAGPSNP